jgi:hypothetical protein
MATFTVREGFIYSHEDDKGNSRIYYPGDTLDIDVPKGENAPHQLELVKTKASA